MKKLTTLLFVASLFFTTNLFAQTVDSVWWALDDFDTTAVSAITDNIDASTLTLAGDLSIFDYSGGALAPNKIRINKGTVGWAVSGPEAQDETQYIQFIVSPKSGFNFHVDSVAFWLACYGTHLYMHAAVYWDTDPNFFSLNNQILLDSATYNVDYPGLPDVRDDVNEIHDTILVIDTDIADGSDFVLRFLPWYNAPTTSTSKHIVLWDVRVYGSTTVTAVEDANTLPKKFALNQNYPNPFNPSTKISFDLEESGYTKLTILNVLGQEIATLVSGEVSAGHHEVDFNALGLTSGIYFYKLESGNLSAIKKMILMR